MLYPDLISNFIFRKSYSPPRLKLQSKKDKDQKSGTEAVKPVEEKKKTEWAAQQRASLNLQDSVENSFREKLVIQVHRSIREQLQRAAGHPGT